MLHQGRAAELQGEYGILLVGLRIQTRERVCGFTIQPLQDDCWKGATELLRMQKSKEYRLRLVLENIFAGAKVSGTRRRQAVEQAILHRVANRFVVADHAFRLRQVFWLPAVQVCADAQRPLHRHQETELQRRAATVEIGHVVYPRHHDVWCVRIRETPLNGQPVQSLRVIRWPNLLRAPQNSQVDAPATTRTRFNLEPRMLLP